MNGLKRILDRLGLKQSEFAALLDVSPRTVSLWATGDVTLPGPVRAYLRVLQCANPSARAAELARLSQPYGQFEDGLYSLTFGLAHEAIGGPIEGSGVALLKAGRIVGSDDGGGKFEGTYRFDSVRLTNHFHVWMRVPPEGMIDAAEGSTVLEVVADIERAGPVASTVVQVCGRPLGLTLAYLGPVAG